MKLSIAYALIAFTVLTADAQVCVSISASGNNDGTSRSNAFKDFQDSIDGAAPGAQIWMAAGT